MPNVLEKILSGLKTRHQREADERKSLHDRYAELVIEAAAGKLVNSDVLYELLQSIGTTIEDFESDVSTKLEIHQLQKFIASVDAAALKQSLAEIEASRMAAAASRDAAIKAATFIFDGEIAALDERQKKLESQLNEFGEREDRLFELTHVENPEASAERDDLLGRLHKLQSRRDSIVLELDDGGGLSGVRGTLANLRRQLASALEREGEAAGDYRIIQRLETQIEKLENRKTVLEAELVELDLKRDELNSRITASDGRLYVETV